jgi:hypothetical protein
VAIDITWVSCRGVRSSLPFHTPCLYASVCVTSYGGKNVQGRRPHRVKTPTDRAGGENPEWEDARLRIYLPGDASSPPPPEQEASGITDDDDGVLVVRFEIKAEVAVLGDVLAASAVVPLSDLVADGRTRRVSYQLAASADGRQHNGVISFSYAFRDGSDDGGQDEDCGSDNCEPVTPPCPVSLEPASSGMYPVMDWPSMEQLSSLSVYPPLREQSTIYPPLREQIAVYPPLTAHTATVTRSTYYYASAPPETRVAPAAIYPPSTRALSAHGIYPTVGEPDNGLYPAVDLAPVSCYTYPPTTAPCYGGGFGYPAVPDCDTRCLYS